LQAAIYPGGNLAWWRLFDEYGKLNGYSTVGNNASQLRLKTSTNLEDDKDDLLGWIDLHPIDQNRIIWKIDPQTVPAMTLSPINAIIDPQAKGPNYGLAPPAIGQRYLLLNAPSNVSESWGNLVAEANDIIEFDGHIWQVKFSARANTDIKQMLTNLFTGKIYQWSGSDWGLYVDQMYYPGNWRLAL
jgi:hypothetical protein